MTDRKLVRVLALDTSTSTGWAHDNAAGSAPMSGTLKLCGWKPKDQPASYARLMEFIETTVNLHGITHVVIERPLSVYAHAGFKGSKARKDPDLAETLLGLASCAAGIAHWLGCDASVVAPSTVRKHFIGHGSPDDPKTWVMKRCRALGWPAIDDNAADALATWDYAKSVLDPGWASRTTPLFAGAAL